MTTVTKETVEELCKAVVEFAKQAIATPSTSVDHDPVLHEMGAQSDSPARSQSAMNTDAASAEDGNATDNGGADGCGSQH